MKKDTTFRHWLVVAAMAGFKIEGKAERPPKVGKHVTPENFEKLTFGQLVELTQGGSPVDVCRVTLGMTEKEVAKARATEVVRYVAWATEQLNKINALFAKLKSTPSPTEIQAGIERLNFGLFGVIDTYAQRMGITDHDEVMKTSWMVVYKCLEIDYQKAQFERRYNKIMESEMKRRNKR